jgi:hypothetical protein
MFLPKAGAFKLLTARQALLMDGCLLPHLGNETLKSELRCRLDDHGTPLKGLDATNFLPVPRKATSLTCDDSRDATIRCFLSVQQQDATLLAEGN